MRHLMKSLMLDRVPEHVELGETLDLFFSARQLIWPLMLYKAPEGTVLWEALSVSLDVYRICNSGR